MRAHPRITVLVEPVRWRRRQRGGLPTPFVYARNPALASVLGANVSSGLGSGTGVRQAGQEGRDVALVAPSSVVADLSSST